MQIYIGWEGLEKWQELVERSCRSGLQGEFPGQPGGRRGEERGMAM